MLLTDSKAISTELINRLKTKQQNVFSITIPIDCTDPLDFYDKLNVNETSKRFYWKSPNEDFAIAGSGSALTLFSGSSRDRFDEVRTLWNEIIQMAEVENKANIPGTGPLIFGGFSFDPLAKKEKIWSNYGDYLFYLPQYMITKSDGQAFFTYNTVIDRSVPKDHIYKRMENYISKLSATVGPVQEGTDIITSEEIRQDEWLNAVENVIDLLKRSAMEKVVLARKMIVKFNTPPTSSFILKQLQNQQPGSYIFSLETGRKCFLGATPERLVKKTGNEVLSACVAGSAPRSDDKTKDEELGTDLLGDPKNRYEHQLVVDMIRNALQPYCEDLHIPDEPVLMKTPAIQHLFTPVTGRAKSGQSIFSMAGKLHPTPALGGVPKTDAMKVIRETEQMDRGFYGAPVGWTDFEGNGEFAVGIRSGLLNGNEAVLYAGCGLVADSRPEDELRETRTKFRPMFNALGGEEL